MDFFEGLRKLETKAGDRALCADANGTVPWRGLSDRVDRLARALLARGVKPGMRIGIMVGRTRYAFLSFLALLRTGAVMVPLPASLGQNYLKHIITASDLAGFVFDAKHSAFASSLLGDRRWALLVQIDGTPKRDAIAWEDLEHGDGTGGALPVVDADAEVYHHYSLDEDECLCGAVGTLGMLWLANTLAVRHLSLPEGAKLLPLFPSSVLLHEIVLRTLALTGTACLAKDLGPKEVWNVIRQHTPEIIFAPRTYCHLLFDWMEKHSLHAHETRIVESRGMVAASVREQCARLFAVPLLATWVPVIGFGPVIGAERGDFGEAPAEMQVYGGYDHRIVDRHGNDVNDQSVGELLLQGDALAKDLIVVRHKARRERLLLPWRTTAMHALATSSGEVRLLGSLHDVVLRAESLVYPHMAMLLLERHPDVREATYVLHEKEPGTLSLVLGVWPQSERKPHVGMLVAHLHKHLSQKALPDDIVILDKFPRLPDGRVDRTRLAAELAERSV